MSAPAVIGAAAEPEAGGVLGYQPETPFLLDGSALRPPRYAGGLPVQPEALPSYQAETPFLSEYGLEGTRDDSRAEAFADLIGELEDEEFEEAVTDLVHEAAALAEESFSFEAGDPASERIEAERGLRSYLEPLALELESMVDRVMEGIGSADLTTMSEAELDELLDRFAPGATSLPPTLEMFGGSFFKKIKKGVQGAVKLAKKGVALAQKFSPVHILLGKLKKMVRPLLDRVLKFAINKLPVSLRPVASQLAKRFLSQARGPLGMEMEDEGEPTAEDPAVIARELDARIAGYTLEGEDFDRVSAAEDYAGDQEAGADAWRELQYERAQFARNITQLEEGEDAAPVVERFVPAIMAALKLGVKLIGRPRVVNFLAGYLAKLIGKYVGKAQAVPLSRALVDTGLKLVSLETPGEAELESGYALASTLEDTISRVAQEAPEAAWESEAVLEAYVSEAFQAAASAHFPDVMIRPELHEAAQSSGAWVLLPGGTRRKHYKKYTRVLEVTVTPQAAAAVKSFGGTPLQAILRDQLSIPAGRPFTARVHMYEAVPGTTLPDIAMHEKGVRGLGTSRREAWSQIHPLTPETAGLLLKEPGLGRQVDAKFLADSNQITVGQRFFYLEIGSARQRLMGPRSMRRPARVSQTRLTFDFPKSEVRIFLFYAEAEAQALSAQLRAKAPIGTLLTALKAGLDARMDLLLSGAPTRAVRIIHESVAVEQFRSPAVGNVIKAVGRPMSRLLRRWVLEALRRELEQRAEPFAAHFTKATVAEADGVTIVIVFRQPSFMGPLRQLLRGASPAAGAAFSSAMGQQALSEYSLTISPGFVRAPVKR